VRDQVSHPYKTTGKIVFFIYFNHSLYLSFIIAWRTSVHIPFSP
jgi:hypothetical protein